MVVTMVKIKTRAQEHKQDVAATHPFCLYTCAEVSSVKG
jgi:hypothetical protein